jgi:hypothetical protein
VLPPGTFNISVKDQLQHISKAQLKSRDSQLIKMA